MEDQTLKQMNQVSYKNTNKHKSRNGTGQTKKKKKKKGLEKDPFG